ncbi:MAG: hypothetical protein HY040_25640 [Planctomycetes bacterium]|nr:hypothetical protein [Planctomycetota bacterium]
MSHKSGLELRVTLYPSTMASAIYGLLAAQPTRPAYWLLAKIGADAEAETFRKTAGMALQLVADECQVYEYATDGYPSISEPVLQYLEKLIRVGEPSVQHSTMPVSCLPADIGLTPEQTDEFWRAMRTITPFSNGGAYSILDGGLFLSCEPVLNRFYLEGVKHLSARNTLVVLAASGIMTRLPSLFCKVDETIDKETIDRIREKFDTERRSYTTYLGKYLAECHERIMDEKYEDAWHYAEFKVNPELDRLCKEYERVVSLWPYAKKVIIATLLEAVPVITKFVFTRHVETPWKLLQSLCKEIKKAVEDRSKDMDRLSGVSYVYHVEHELKKSR